MSINGGSAGCVAGGIPIGSTTWSNRCKAGRSSASITARTSAASLADDPGGVASGFLVDRLTLELEPTDPRGPPAGGDPHSAVLAASQQLPAGATKDHPLALVTLQDAELVQESDDPRLVGLRVARLFKHRLQRAVGLKDRSVLVAGGRVESDRTAKHVLDVVRGDPHFSPFTQG